VKRDEGDDSGPGVARLPIVHEANRPLALALGNHALVLEQVRVSVSDLAERVRIAESPIASGELAQIGRAFRQESDSASDLARAAELAAGGKG